MRLKETGFTLVEILVISPIVMLTIVLLTSYLFGQYGQLTQQGAQINLQVEGQNISFSMQDDVFFATHFGTTKEANLDDPYAPTGGWDYDTDPDTLIIATVALTGNRRDDAREPVYVNTEGCTPDEVKETNGELLNNIIYFVEGTNLYKRILSAPSSLATCGTSYMKQTCPAGQVSPTCPADKLLTDKLEDFTITYYDGNDTEVASPDTAEKVRVDIRLKDRSFAEDIFTDTSITLKKLNQ